jgi:hypothetical protein
VWKGVVGKHRIDRFIRQGTACQPACSGNKEQATDERKRTPVYIYCAIECGERERDSARNISGMNLFMS